MDWSNEKAIEFLELFQTEPCLWDPGLKSHKNRGAQSDAWRRISEALSFSTTIEELKKKKDSLMGYYRIHLNKYKKSLKSGAGTSDIYTTNWFAFNIMNDFLKPIYEGNTTMATELSTPTTPASPDVETVREETQETQGLDRESSEVLSSESRSEEGSKVFAQSKTVKRPLSSQSNYKQPTQQFRHVTKKMPPEILAAKNQMDEAFKCLKSMSAEKHTSAMDEYDHFGFMIAAKIRKISDCDEREILMNSIQNLIFNSHMEKRQSREHGEFQDSNITPYSSTPNSHYELDIHSSTSRCTSAEVYQQNHGNLERMETNTYLHPLTQELNFEAAARPRILGMSETGAVQILSNDVLIAGGYRNNENTV